MGNENQLLRKQPGHLLRRGYQKGLAIFLDKLSETDVTPLRLTVLMALNESGPCTQKALSDMVAMEPSNVHPMLRSMQENELVVIEVSAEDKRRSHVVMTDKGKRLLESLMVIQYESSQELLMNLTEVEQKEFIRLLEKVTCDEGL